MDRSQWSTAPPNATLPNPPEEERPVQTSRPPTHVPWGAAGPTLTAAASGVVAAAAIWIGLAMVISAYTYRLAPALHALLAFGGGWLVAAGIAYVAMASRPAMA